MCVCGGGGGGVLLFGLGYSNGIGCFLAGRFNFIVQASPKYPD